MAENVNLRVRDEEGRRKPQHIKLTVRRVENLMPPSTGRIRVYDTEQKGLCVVVAASGMKTYTLLRRVKSKLHHVTLGRADDLALDDARRMAASKIADALEGKDPTANRHGVDPSMTLGQLWQKFRDEKGNSWKPRTRDSYQSRYDVGLKDWDKKPLDYITPERVEKRYRKLRKEKGGVTANRTIQMLRAMFYFARKKGLQAENPAAQALQDTDRYRENPRRHTLSVGELGRFWLAAEAEPTLFADYFKMLTLTGARRSNVSAMAWSEIDFKSKVWRIPGEKMKAGVPHNVPLTTPMLEILKRRKAEQAEHADKLGERKAYVFPAHRREGKSPHLTEPKGALDRIRKRAGLSHITIHDLRRTLASIATNRAGVSSHIVSAMLGHLPDKKDVTAVHYSHVDAEAIHEAFVKTHRVMIDAVEKHRQEEHERAQKRNRLVE